MSDNGASESDLSTEQPREQLNAFFRMLETVLSKAQGSISLEYPKMIMHMAAMMETEARNEYEKHNICSALANYMICILRPHVLKCEDNQIRVRFNDILGEVKQCHLARLSSAVRFDGDRPIYTFRGESGIGKTLNEETKKLGTRYDGHVDAFVVEVLPQNVVIGREVARDNLYNKNNCSIEKVMYDILAIACELGVIGVGDALTVDSGQITEEDVDAEFEAIPE